MSLHTWHELAEAAEKENTNCGRIVAALCRHFGGLPGGASPVEVSDELVHGEKPKHRKS